MSVDGLLPSKVMRPEDAGDAAAGLRLCDLGPAAVIVWGGGKVVKNVAGYDLMKLHIGALGTLGVVAEVNFKVQARPEAQATVLGHFDAALPAIGAATSLARQYLAPSAAIVIDRHVLWACGLTADWRWALALKLEGYGREVDAARGL